MNNNKYSCEQKGEIKRKILFWTHLIFLIVGVCCCLQFFVVGLIGISRGYSIESNFPSHIMLIGSIFLVFLGLKSKKSIVWGLGIFTIFYQSIIGINQGKFYSNGMEYYEHRQYTEALHEFAKENETWYLQLEYNYFEYSALNMMVKSYCQLGDFKKASEILAIIANRYPDVRGYFANKDLARIQEGLKKINNIDTSFLEKKPDVFEFYDLARTYRYDLGCDSKSLEIYKRIINMPIDDNLKEEARQAIQILK